MTGPTEPAHLAEPLGELTFLGKDRDSAGGNCPSVFKTSRGSYVVQGWRIRDEAALAELRAAGMPDWEDAVEIPANMAHLFRES